MDDETNRTSLEAIARAVSSVNASAPLEDMRRAFEAMGKAMNVYEEANWAPYEGTYRDGKIWHDGRWFNSSADIKKYDFAKQYSVLSDEDLDTLIDDLVELSNSREKKRRPT